MTQIVSSSNYTAASNSFTLTNGAQAGRAVVMLASQFRNPLDITANMTFNGVAATQAWLNPNNNLNGTVVGYWNDAALPAAGGAYTVAMEFDPTIWTVFEISGWDGAVPEVLEERLAASAWTSPYSTPFTTAQAGGLLLCTAVDETTSTFGAFAEQTQVHTANRMAIISKSDANGSGAIQLAASDTSYMQYSALSFNPDGVSVLINDVNGANTVVPGTTATINGSNLGNTTAVDIGGEAQTAVTVVSAEQVTFTVIRGDNPYEKDLTLTLTSSDGSTTQQIQQVVADGEFAVTAESPNITDEESLWTGLVDTATGDPVTIVNGDQALLKDVNNLGSLVCTPSGVISANNEGEFLAQIRLASSGVWGTNQTVTFSETAPAGAVPVITAKLVADSADTALPAPVNVNVRVFTPTNDLIGISTSTVDTTGVFSVDENDLTLETGKNLAYSTKYRVDFQEAGGDRQRSVNLSTNADPNNSGAFFANGEQGVWYDISDVGTIFQDTSGNTPVAADGDTVGRIEDKSGNGNHLLGGTTKPVYRTDGTNHWIEFNGTSDFMYIQNQSVLQFADAFTYTCTVAPTSVLNDMALYVKENGTPWNKININSGGGIRGTVTTTNTGTVDLDSATGVLADGVRANPSARLGSGTFEVLNNGSVLSTTSVAGTATYTEQQADFGIRGGGDYFNGKLFGLLLIGRALTDTELQGYASRTGAL